MATLLPRRGHSEHGLRCGASSQAAVPEAAIDGGEVPRLGVMRAQVEVAVQAPAADVHWQLDQPLHQRRVDVAPDDVQLREANPSAVHMLGSFSAL